MTILLRSVLPYKAAILALVLCVIWAGILLGSLIASSEGAFSEAAREAYGLLVCAGWIFVLYRRSG